jgi:hypothetical protein
MLRKLAKCVTFEVEDLKNLHDLGILRTWRSVRGGKVGEVERMQGSGKK